MEHNYIVMDSRLRGNDGQKSAWKQMDSRLRGNDGW